jgi:hypothetical protein
VVQIVKINQGFVILLFAIALTVLCIFIPKDRLLIIEPMIYFLLGLGLARLNSNWEFGGDAP